jgi:hypothetical protein
MSNFRMDPNGIRDNAVSNTQVEGLKTVRSWSSMHGISGMCTPGCICTWALDEPEPCGDREREAMHIPGAAEAAKAAAEEASRLATARASEVAAAGGSSTTTAVNASSGGGGETKPLSSGPPSLNLQSYLTSTSVRATPALLSPTLGQFTGIPKTGACSPDCSCPWGRQCYDSTRNEY